MTNENQCNLKTINDSQVNAVVRAFWRRIYPYRNDYVFPRPTDIQGEALIRCNAALEVIRKFRGA